VLKGSLCLQAVSSDNLVAEELSQCHCPQSFLKLHYWMAPILTDRDFKSQIPLMTHPQEAHLLSPSEAGAGAKQQATWAVHQWGEASIVAVPHGRAWALMLIPILCYLLGGRAWPRQWGWSPMQSLVIRGPRVAVGHCGGVRQGLAPKGGGTGTFCLSW
jgi:hypothetical protein